MSYENKSIPNIEASHIIDGGYFPTKPGMPKIGVWTGPYKLASTDFKIIEVGPTKLRITGRALTPTTSKNQRKYVREAIIKATNTWINKPVLANHDFNRVVGNVELMDFNESTDELNYTAQINNKQLVQLIREKSASVKGISIGANYMWNKCSITNCGKKFDSEDAWHKHVTEEHFLKDVPREPHGIIGTEISVVLSPEECGVDGTSINIAETKSSFLRLYEVVLEDKGVKEVSDSGNMITRDSNGNITVTDTATKTGHLDADSKPVYDKPVSAEAAKISEAVAFLRGYSDKKVCESFNYLLNVMDENVTAATKLVKEAQSKAGVTEALNKLAVTEQTLAKVTSERDVLAESDSQQKKQITTLKAEVAKRDELVEVNRKLIIENDNLKDKLTLFAQFKGHSPGIKSKDNQPGVTDPFRKY
jgi:hypothetical protein